MGLFSGAGGLDLGFEKAGFNHVSSMDILNCAVSTLKRNRPNWNVLEADIREYNPTEKNVDVLLAGFPCQPFSIMGFRKGFRDPRGNLFFEIIEVARQIQPKIIFLENVAIGRSRLAVALAT